METQQIKYDTIKLKLLPTQFINGKWQFHFDGELKFVPCQLIEYHVFEAEDTKSRLVLKEIEEINGVIINAPPFYNK